MKKCPYCAEQIQDEAIVCRYCGRDLPQTVRTTVLYDGQPVTSTPQSNPQALQPVLPVQQQSRPKAKMTLAELLLSPGGRIPRSTFWFYQLSMIGLIFVAAFADGLLGTFNSDSGYGFISGILMLVWFITSIFVLIKRSHDLNWSGWYILFSIVPIGNLIVGIYWAFVKGTVGPNKYGLDPTQ